MSERAAGRQVKVEARPSGIRSRKAAGGAAVEEVTADLSKDPRRERESDDESDDEEDE